jgi:hypothetical protein
MLEDAYVVCPQRIAGTEEVQVYKDDQARIERWCKNPDKLLTVGTMVLLSIRMQWVGVGNQMESVRLYGSKSPCLWGWKRAGFIYLRDNRKRLYAHVRDYRRGRIDIGTLLSEFLKVPGLGLPKAGFMCQLLVGEVGCLDMHNISRFDLKPSVWVIRPRRKADAQLREIDDKIELYLNLCIACGGSEKLWDDWCEHLNDKVGTFHNADDVSRRHWIYLLGLPGD